MYILDDLNLDLFKVMFLFAFDSPQEMDLKRPQICWRPGGKRNMQILYWSGGLLKWPKISGIYPTVGGSNLEKTF